MSPFWKIMGRTRWLFLEGSPWATEKSRPPPPCEVISPALSYWVASSRPPRHRPSSPIRPGLPPPVTYPQISSGNTIEQLTNPPADCVGWCAAPDSATVQCRCCLRRGPSAEGAGRCRRVAWERGRMTSDDIPREPLQSRPSRHSPNWEMSLGGVIFLCLWTLETSLQNKFSKILIFNG